MSNEDTNKKPEPQITFANRFDYEEGSIFQTIRAGVAYFVHLLTWVLSLGSPVLISVFVRNGQHGLLAALLGLTVMAYLPWERGYISDLATIFVRFQVYWYKKCSVIYVSKESMPQRCVDDPKQQKRPSLYAVHPHGAFAMGWSILYSSKIMHEGKVRFVFAPGLYISPLFRLWSRMVGRPGSSSKTSMIRYMKDIQNETGRPGDLALIPGGFEDATLSCIDKDRVYIKKRVGFIKLALQHGFNVVPTYSFGENQTYSNVQGLWKFRLWLNSLSVPGIVVFGSWLFPLLPKRHPKGLTVVVGEPLVLPTISDPTRDEVKLWHDKYMASLVRLFEEHKEAYYGPEIAKTAKLELW